MQSFFKKIPVYVSLVVFLFLVSCGPNGKLKDKLPDLDDLKETISKNLDLKLGQSVALNIPLDVFCGFLGTPGKTCREQLFASQYNFFRMYPAIHNRFPALVLTRVDNNGKQAELEDGRANYILVGVNLQGKMDPAATVNKATATEAVTNFRETFPSAPQVFTLNYQDLLGLFSTIGQEVPQGQKPIKNHLGVKIYLEDNGNVDMGLVSYFGTATIAEFPLTSGVLPVWIDICPGECGPDANYFLPPSSN